MPHIYPPEDPRSAASTFAPHQPGAGVVADDVEHEDGLKAEEANEKFADEPLPDSGPGPDRPGHKPFAEMDEDELRLAAGVGDPPRGEGRKGEATRERDEKRREEADDADDGVPITQAMQRPGASEPASKSEPAPAPKPGSSSKSSNK